MFICYTALAVELFLFGNRDALSLHGGECAQAFEIAETERKTDLGVRHFIAKCFEEVVSFLVDHQDALVAVTKAILQKRTLEKDELERVIEESGVPRGKRWNLRL